MTAVALLTRQETAERARISVPTLDRLVKAGRGPALVRLGKRVFVTETELACWIERSGSSTTTPVAAGER